MSENATKEHTVTDERIYDPDTIDAYGSYSAFVDAALFGHVVRPSGEEWESHRDVYLPFPHDYKTHDEWDEAAWTHARLCVSDWYAKIRAVG